MWIINSDKVGAHQGELRSTCRMGDDFGKKGLKKHKVSRRYSDYGQSYVGRVHEKFGV